MKHGHATGGIISPTYHSWSGMLARCTNPKNSHFKYYGGAGITVCKRWRRFANFLADMGEKPAGTSIERKDRAHGYCKSNCRWATEIEQARNRSNNRFMTFCGETKTQAEWCEITGLRQSTLNDRLANGWSDDRALGTPAGTSGNNAKSRLLTHAGQTLCISDWARKLSIQPGTISRRLSRGWNTERALS